MSELETNTPDALPKLIAFDIDDTLAVSKQPLTTDMAEALAELLERTQVAIISGGMRAQFERQILARLPEDARLENLFLLPTSGAQAFTYEDGTWEAAYQELLTPKEVSAITIALQQGGESTGLVDFRAPSAGERIEDRGAQVSLSVLGQQAAVEDKKAWDPTGEKRDALRAAIAPLLPDYDVKRGGMTTIDVTKRGINKAYGIRKLSDISGIAIEDMLYVGDALYPGGNDEVVKETGIRTHAVTGPDDTLMLIHSFVDR